MTVLVTGNLSPGINGWLNKFFLEIRCGVFIGDLSKRNRDEIFESLQKQLAPKEYIMMAYNDNTLQGFSIKWAGDTPVQLVKNGNIVLVKKLALQEN